MPSLSRLRLEKCGQKGKFWCACPPKEGVEICLFAQIEHKSKNNTTAPCHIPIPPYQIGGYAAFCGGIGKCALSAQNPAKRENTQKSNDVKERKS